MPTAFPLAFISQSSLAILMGPSSHFDPQTQESNFPSLHEAKTTKYDELDGRI
jgi:hypothetical protein